MFITLIDRRYRYLFEPLVDEVAMTVLSTSEITSPIRHLYRGWSEAETLLGMCRRSPLTARRRF